MEEDFDSRFTTEPFEISWDVVSSLPPRVIKQGWKQWRVQSKCCLHLSAQSPNCGCVSAALCVALRRGFREGGLRLSLQSPDLLGRFQSCMHLQVWWGEHRVTIRVRRPGFESCVSPLICWTTHLLSL